ncbi:MAG: ISNCY family transposase [Myxococcales bacterium]|nr:ISNCY family transposase [Myxococcales bacterium]
MGFSRAAWERAMRFQEVILRAMSGEITWIRAAEIVGVTDRTMRRMRARYQAHGYDGLLDRRRRTPSARRAPVEEVERVLRLYREKYRGLNVRHFHALVVREEGVTLSYSFVRKALQEAGLVKKQRPRGRPRESRPRRGCRGEMLLIDGSAHRWLLARPDETQTLLAIQDDATGELLHARLWPSETTESVLWGLREVTAREGVCVSLYSDRAGWAFHTPEGSRRVSRAHLTQVGRALAALGVEHIAAYSPQAKGRIERLFKTLQGRLPGELRLRGITTVGAANRYLGERFAPAYNAEFAVPPQDPQSAFVAVEARDLDRVFCRRTARSVDKDGTVRWGKRRLALAPRPGRSSWRGAQVTLCEHLDGTASVFQGPRLLGRWDAAGRPLGVEEAEGEDAPGSALRVLPFG